MKLSSPLLAAIAAIVSATAGFAETITIWHETFDNIGTSSTKWSSSGTSLNNVDVSGWTVVSGVVYIGQKGVRVGAAQTAASYKSPAIAPNNTVNGIVVTVNAAAYYNVAGTQYLKVVVQNASGTDLAIFGGSSSQGGLDGKLKQHTSADAVELAMTSDYMKTFTIPSSILPASGNVFLVFSCDSSNPSAQNRLLIGDVLVQQDTTSTNPPSGPTALSAPGNVTASSITASGFSLSWDSVANAANYDVYVTDGNGSSAGTATVNGTSATVSGLASDTTYTVKVKALAANGSLDYLDSSWSSSVSVTTALGGGLERKTLFFETFDSFGGKWNSTTTTGKGTLEDNAGWTYNGNVYLGMKGLRLGSTTLVGSGTTPVMVLSNSLDFASVSISFLAASYTSKTTTGTVTLIDCTSGSDIDTDTVINIASPASMSNGTEEILAGGTNYTETITVPARFKLRFESLSTASDPRLLLDSILVTQVIDPNIQTLSEPTITVTDGDSTDSISFNWSSVANAVSYEWQVTSSGGSVTNDAGTALAGYNYFTTINNLAPGTEYTVRVRAIGDNLHYRPSAWASKTATTEALSFSVTFSVDSQEGAYFEKSIHADECLEISISAFLSSNDGTSEDVKQSLFVEEENFGINPLQGGSFVWTPSEADVGTHTATISYEHSSGTTFSCVVSITVLSNNRSETLFEENFSALSSNSWGNNSARMESSSFDESGWITNNNNCLKGHSGMRLGGGNGAYGSATTRMIEAKGEGESTVTLSFLAAYTQGAAGQFSVTATGLSGATLYSGTFGPKSTVSGSFPILEAAYPTNSIGEEISSIEISVDEPFTLTFSADEEGGSVRIGIDSILVTQTVPASMQDMETPTGLALTAGSVTTSGFSATWTAVDSATGYDVRVFDGSGAIVKTVLTATASATVTGLDPNTAYTAKVRAKGNTSLFFASPWSEAVSFTTVATKPTLVLSHNATNVIAGTEITVTLIGGSPSGLALTYAVSPNAGTIAEDSETGAATFTYTPTAVGQEQFTFTVRDSTGTSDAETFTVTATLGTPVVTATATDCTAAVLSWDTVAGVDHYLVGAIGTVVRGAVAIRETFDGFTNHVGSTAVDSTYMDKAGWTLANAYRGDASNTDKEAGTVAKFGTGSGAGSLTTPALDLSGNNGNFVVVFDARRWSGDKTKLDVSLNGTVKETIALTDTLETYIVSISGGAANSTVAITAYVASNNRFFLDNLRIVSGTATQQTVADVSVAAGTTSYSATGLTPDTAYTFTVTAVAEVDGAEVTTSASASVMTPEAPSRTVVIFR